MSGALLGIPDNIPSLICCSLPDFSESDESDSLHYQTRPLSIATTCPSSVILHAHKARACPPPQSHSSFTSKILLPDLTELRKSLSHELHDFQDVSCPTSGIFTSILIHSPTKPPHFPLYTTLNTSSSPLYPFVSPPTNKIPNSETPFHENP